MKRTCLNCGAELWRNDAHATDCPQHPANAPAPSQEPDATDSKSTPLPPDPEGMNDKRASWAQAALDAFMQATGSEPETALVDLLADLMHWHDRSPEAGQARTDFETILEVARDHYEVETKGEPA